jgi:hypothetical protein
MIIDKDTRRYCCDEAGFVLDGLGAEVADALIEAVITTLRRAWPNRSRHDLEVLLGDLRTNAAHDLSLFADRLIETAVDVAADTLEDLEREAAPRDLHAGSGTDVHDLHGDIDEGRAKAVTQKRKPAP